MARLPAIPFQQPNVLSRPCRNGQTGSGQVNLESPQGSSKDRARATFLDKVGKRGHFWDWQVTKLYCGVLSGQGSLKHSMCLATDHLVMHSDCIVSQIEFCTVFHLVSASASV